MAVGKIITDNLSQEFRTARSVVVSQEDLPAKLQRTMKRRAASGITLDKVAEQYYNPSIRAA